CQLFSVHVKHFFRRKNVGERNALHLLFFRSRSGGKARMEEPSGHRPGEPSFSKNTYLSEILAATARLL
ncbi:hypothetical protein NLB58_09290, partial [Porphyromonas gingivalis]|uniref:hypothetical protein n=1 Tax=Porphyromonas gingivalis TaxID=837 RepID=UPI002731156A